MKPLILCVMPAAASMLPAAEPETEQEKNMNTLTVKEQVIVDIGAAVARGEQKTLASALNRGFDAGLTLAEAKEYVGQLYAYCGFPRALNAATTLQNVVNERAASNRPVPEGKQPSALPAGKSIDFGTANQTKLCGAPVKGGLFDFHPQLDEYLKAHLFGDIFARDNVDWRTRELLTVAALAARPETEPQMKAHLQIAKNNGVTDEQGAAIVARGVSWLRCPPVRSVFSP